MSDALTLRWQHQRLDKNKDGYRVWRTREQTVTLDPQRTALVLCDVWDRHWCCAAQQRLERILPRMNRLVGWGRTNGILIVHAPSDTMAAYADAPARQRVLAAAPVELPADLPHIDPPLPIDASDGGCDSADNPGAVDERVWTRQHPAIEIDHRRDVISDDGQELYRLYRQRGIQYVLILGVHANMCILNRSFAIKQMVRWGFTVALVRDLTDAMYNPARPPYVSHAEGTRLVLDYIEKFWCPTVSSADLLGG